MEPSIDDYQYYEESIGLEESNGVKIITQNLFVETKSQKQSIRGKAFIMVEDEALCRAYLAVSQDLVLGTNQSATNFWDRVRSFFFLPNRSSIPEKCCFVITPLAKKISKV